MRLTWGGLVVATAIALTIITSACDAPSRSHQVAAVETACERVTLGWGKGESQLGLTEGGDEVVRRGPAAAAIGPDNQRLLLDPVRGRLVELKGSRAIAIAAVAVDADDLAIGPDGAIAVFSSTRHLAWIHDPGGRFLGEVAVPRTVRAVTGIELGRSRELTVRTALQERVPVGSPAAPRSLQASIAGTRDGAFATADGRGVAARVSDRSLELLLTGADRTVDRMAVTTGVDGANLIGVASGVACLRVERVTQPGSTIEVDRRAMCVELASGKLVLDRALPPPGLYQPRAELALGGDSLALASLQPSVDGLTIETCEVPR